MPYSTLIDRAFAFAAQAHEGQFRKDPDRQVPYIAHPSMVAMILQRCGFGEEVIAAAILHDVIEDTDIDTAAIRERFGDKVAKLVDFVSEQDKSLSWEARKSAYTERLHEAPLEALAISAADKIHNLRSIELSLQSIRKSGGDPKSVWDIFKRGPEAKLSYYQDVRDVILDRAGDDRRFQRLLAELNSSLQTVQQLVER